MDPIFGQSGELRDAVLAHPVLGGSLPESAARHIERAAITYHLTDVAETHLAAAEEAAPGHVAVLIAKYRFFFYKGRLADALGVARTCIQRALAENRLDPDWRTVRVDDAPFGEWDALLPRFLLFSLKGYGYLSMRLGAFEEGRRAVNKLLELDPKDRIGARVLLDVLDRMEEGADE